MKKLSLVLIVCMIALFGVACGEPQVDPELKEMLDSYEKAADSYVEMVDKYREAAKNDDLTALAGLSADCIKLMNEYQECAAKVDEVDFSNLEDVDYDYYEEVTTRVLEKISDAMKQYNDAAGDSSEKGGATTTEDMANLLDSESELLDSAADLLEQTK